LEELTLNKRNFWLAGFIAIISLILNFQLVLAHGSITVGDYTIEIGWLNEPPIVGQQNAIVVNVSTISDEQPVEDVSALTVTISYGGQEKPLSLQPLSEDTPGQFIAPIIPTVAGEYMITLGGQLGDTTIEGEVHPEEVASADILQFPNVGFSEQSASSGTRDWLIYSSILISLIALVLAVGANRKPR
jgi:hypothetical protein